MLVADRKDAQLHRILRDREGLRVFAALDENGNISQEMMDRACRSVAAMQEKAKKLGAQCVHLFATSAVRDARNQERFSAALEEATGLRLEICSGDEEARLSFLGATEGRRAGMIDIGGGSTEIVVGEGETFDFAESLQMGAVRLYRLSPIASVEDARRVRRIAAELLAPKREALLRLVQPDEWFGVGGTFTTTAALVQGISWTDKERVHGFRARREVIERVSDLLAPMSMEERLKLPGLQPQRADIVVHGLAILLACMESLELSSITVSEYGNLEGYLKRRYLDA
ncbi:MAG: hypothetical protein PHY12_11045 [Eubacteriales bacterium]|nr:hypothetical protein [Eubacteriales bacterium]